MALRDVAQVELLCASLLGGYDGAAEDIKGWRFWENLGAGQFNAAVSASSGSV